MHYHLEVILPPTDNVKKCIEQILEEYNENYQDEDGMPSKYSFYDYYVVGGRWEGAKLEAMLDKDRMDEFNKILIDNKITVSGLQFGKQTLQPDSQIPLVNELWNKHFPDSPIKECLLFDNYENDFGDILKLKDLPKKLECSRLIIASNSLKVEYMLSKEIWNGSNHEKTAWDGRVESGLQEYTKSLKGYNKEWRKDNTPTDDWLCVTVDYHN